MLKEKALLPEYQRFLLYHQIYERPDMRFIRLTHHQVAFPVVSCLPTTSLRIQGAGDGL